MFPRKDRAARFPPQLIERVLALLAQNTRDSRLAAAQLLAHGYELDEEQRRAERPPDPG